MASSAVATLSADGKTQPAQNQQSPRNTGGQSTTAVKLGTIEVPKALQDGEKFLKWDEVSAKGDGWPSR